MKTVSGSKLSIFLFCAVSNVSNICISNAFTVPSLNPKLQISSDNRRSFFFSTKDESSDISEVISLEGGVKSRLLNASLHEEWMDQLQSAEMQEVRQEMLAKYVSFGKTSVEAEIEVDKFLSDPEQSLQYLEMRQYAKSQQLMGSNVESLLGLIGAFALGMMGTVAIKYFDLGNGPF